MPVSNPDKKKIGGKTEVFQSGMLFITPRRSPGYIGTISDNTQPRYRFHVPNPMFGPRVTI